MTTLRLASLGATMFLVGWGVHARHVPEPSGGHGRSVVYYQDPMHPSYRSNKPGKAPDCGMDLVPVYADATGSRALREDEIAIVRVAPDRLETFGIASVRVERTRLRHTYRTVGRVAADENRVFAVTAGGDGWVTRTYPGSATGDLVRKGQPLAKVYGREYTTAQRTFLFALRARENPPPASPAEEPGGAALAFEEARLQLETIGVGGAELRQLAATRRLLPEVTLVAPASGVVLARRLLPNQRFDRGVELFTIADLSRVWIVADLFERDAPRPEPGIEVRVLVANQPTAVIATVASALPRLDPASRVLKVRLEAENPGLKMTPDQIVDLEFAEALPEAITVPASAIVDDGLARRAFVVRGAGVFEPRRIEVGWQRGDRVEVTSGLHAGDAVVVTGAFLLEAERRMRLRHD